MRIATAYLNLESGRGVDTRIRYLKGIEVPTIRILDAFLGGAKIRLLEVFV